MSTDPPPSGRDRLLVRDGLARIRRPAGVEWQGPLLFELELDGHPPLPDLPWRLTTPSSVPDHPGRFAPGFPTDLLGLGITIIGDAPAKLPRSARLAREVIRTHREQPGTWIYAPGVATPANLAALVGLGIELVDTARMILDGHRRIVYVNGEVIQLAEGEPSPCTCQHCSDGDLIAHDKVALAREMTMVRRAIGAHDLRSLIELRSTIPETFGLLHAIPDPDQPDLPVGNAERSFAFRGEVSLRRPEVVAFQNRIGRYATHQGRTLLLIPCSARKPYMRSKTHRILRRVIGRHLPDVHEVIVTSPLGLVPRELECAWPAQHYDTLATGTWWPAEERLIVAMAERLVHNGSYSRVIHHHDSTFLKEAIPGLDTGRDRPLARENLDALKEALQENQGEGGGGHAKVRADVESILRFQLDPEAKLPAAAQIKGKAPYLKVWLDNAQLGMTTEDRGILSLTLQGAEHWADLVPRVMIEDFDPKGTVFSVGVTGTSGDFGQGQEVAVYHGEELRGIGVALARPADMLTFRVPAVKVRHRRKPGQPG